MNAIKVVVLLLVGFLICESESVRFEVQLGQAKCMAEEMNINSMSVGKYSVVNSNDSQPLPNSHKLTVRVTSPSGTNLHKADEVESGQIGFVAPEAGSYMVCFWTTERKPESTLTVDFEWKTGVAAKDWTNVAKKGAVEGMEYELKRLLDDVQSIQDEMLYLRQREEEMQELNRATNTKMAWLSLLSLIICLSVAILQIWHLRTFFEKKKII